MVGDIGLCESHCFSCKIHSAVKHGAQQLDGSMSTGHDGLDKKRIVKRVPISLFPITSGECTMSARWQRLQEPLSPCPQ